MRVLMPVGIIVNTGTVDSNHLAFAASVKCDSVDKPEFTNVFSFLSFKSKQSSKTCTPKVRFTNNCYNIQRVLF